MLITNKTFHDYYDTALAFVDKTIVFDREQRTLSVPISPFAGIDVPDGDFFILCFCGKTYLFTGIHYQYGWMNGEASHILTLQDVSFSANEREKPHPFHKSTVKSLIEKYANGAAHPDLFQQFNAPVFSIKASERDRDKAIILINPCLKLVGFQKIFDAYTAAQEIQMFLSGVLGAGSNTTVSLSNESKIAKHGFDKKSFRKEKE